MQKLEEKVALSSKIRNFFSSIDCEPLAILEMTYDGLDVEDCDYAVVHKGSLTYGDRYSRLVGLGNTLGIKIIPFDIGQNEVSDFLKDTSKNDSYNLVYRNLSNEIKELFNYLGCEPLVILQTPLVGREIENGLRFEEILKEYYVIHKGDLIDQDAYPEILEFEKKYEVGISPLDFEGVENIDRLILEMNEKDSYEVLYRNFNLQ